MFQRLIDQQLERVRNSPQAGMLGEKVYEKLEGSLKRLTGLITQSTEAQLIARAADNPFAAALPALLTEEEKADARDRLLRQLERGEIQLPQTLADVLDLQLKNKTDAFLEAVARMADDRDAICAALLDGRKYRTIDDVTLSAGDTHDCGRSVTVFHTDAGKLVYKPHDMRLDGQLYLFAECFFSEFVGIPRSIAFGDRYGVCEFIEKRRAEGYEEAERFWYALGGLTAFVKLLRSTDLHYQNILCCGAKPYIIDLETIISPVSSEQTEYEQSTQTRKHLLRTPGASLIMPGRINEQEFSVLMNVGEDGIAPVVDGEIVSVRRYLDVFKDGYQTAYTRILENKAEIEKAVRLFDPDAKVRLVLRPTRGYWEMLKKLYHHTALASRENREQNMETLRALLRDCSNTISDRVVDSEIMQMRRGDVPYFYTHAGSLSLYGEGEELVENRFSVSAISQVLDTLHAMDERDRAFDLAYIDRSIRQYPESSQGRSNGSPFRREEKYAPIRAEEASEEAARIFREMYALRILTPDGKPQWGYVSNISQAFSFSDHSLFNGLTGIAVFASACAAVLPDESIREMAEELRREANSEIKDFCCILRTHDALREGTVPVGEASGLAGVLTGIALMKRFSGSTAEAICGDVLELLEKTDLSKCSMPDRINGLAGLVSAMCRFEEYHGFKAVIGAAADRLLELKTLVYREDILWKTMDGIPRPLSGAGHGMTGIAEALISAAALLGDARYLPSAADALDYELKMYRRYSERFGTWADLRDMPPKTYMHGYCSGAPGAGIMLSRIMKHDSGQTVRTLTDCVCKSVDTLPLNHTDHLCCGNAAIVEYYLSTGNTAAAGGVLATMYAHRQRFGSYRDPSGRANRSITASLFNGMSGIGYEMLRYAYPDKIPSIL